MSPVFKADAPAFIWLIVGIFWVISQIAGAAAKKKPPSRAVSPDTDPGKPPVDPLAELLRKLNDPRSFEMQQIETEELPEEPAEPPALVSQNARRIREIENLPDIEPLRRETLAPEPAVQETQVSIRPTMKAFRNTLPAMKLPSMRLNFQPLEISDTGSVQTGQKVPILGKIINPGDKASLRRAMLSHIIFSPPKALERQ